MTFNSNDIYYDTKRKYHANQKNKIFQYVIWE